MHPHGFSFKKPQIWHIWPTFCMGISYQWSLRQPGLVFHRCGQLAAPSPFPHHLLFHIASWSLMDLSLERVDLHNCPTLQTACSLFFSLQLHPFIPWQCQLLNQHSSQRTNYFLLPHFLSSFQLNHSPFLPLSPHILHFLSLKLRLSL